MKKKIGLIVLLVVVGGIFAFGQKGKYMMAMGKNLGQFGKAETVAELVVVANKFETIAKAEKKEWLPYYYNGLVNVIISFDESLSKEEKDGYLDKAQVAIDSMLVIVPNEAEVYALEGFMNVGRLVVDPAVRGQEYNMKTAKSCNKALALDAENPRAKYLLLSNEFGAAKFFGADTTELCKKAQELLDVWDDFEVESRMHPNWGKDELEEIVASCKSE